MRSHGLFEAKLFFSVDEHKAFPEQFELLWIDTDIDLLSGQTNMDLMRFLF